MTQRAKRYEVEDDCGQPRATAPPQTQLHGVSVVLFRLELKDFPGRIATHAKLQSPSDATVRCMGGLLFFACAEFPTRAASPGHFPPPIACLTAKTKRLGSS